MVTLNPEQDIRTYLDATKNKKISLTFSIYRNPLELEPFFGTVDDLYLIYNFQNYLINEQFAEVWTKNKSDKPLKKGVLEDNVYPTQNDAIEKIWAQLGHRISFIKDRGIDFSLSFNKNTIDLSKKLPHLPYSIKTDFTLDEIMKFAEKNYWGYQRFTRFLNDDEHESKIFENLIQNNLIHSA